MSLLEECLGNLIPRGCGQNSINLHYRYRKRLKCGCVLGVDKGRDTVINWVFKDTLCIAFRCIDPARCEDIVDAMRTEHH